MNVGPANTVRPVNSAVEVRQQGERNASSFEQEELPAKSGGHPSEGESASEKKVDAHDTLRLLSEGRLNSAEGARFRLHFPGADGKAADVRAEAKRLTKTALAPLREILNVGLFDEETRTLLEEAFAQVKSDVDELQAEEDEEGFDAQQLYLDLQEAFEQYHEMLKQIFRLVETTTPEEGEEEKTGAASSESGERSDRTQAEEVWSRDPADEGEETAAEEEEEWVHRMLEAIEQALEDVQEKTDEEDARASSDASVGEEESVYAEFIAAYENLSEASVEAGAFNTEG